jgi:hypothetical protein
MKCKEGRWSRELQGGATSFRALLQNLKQPRIPGRQPRRCLHYFQHLLAPAPQRHRNLWLFHRRASAPPRLATYDIFPTLVFLVDSPAAVSIIFNISVLPRPSTIVAHGYSTVVHPLLHFSPLTTCFQPSCCWSTAPLLSPLFPAPPCSRAPAPS